MKERVVPKKNYYILLLIIIAVVILTFSLVSIVNAINSKKITSGYINKYVSELQYDELENYLIEPASNTFIYITYTGDEEVYNLETKLKKIINNYELQSNFIYVDATEEMVKENFYNNLNSKIGAEMVEKLPIILYYKDGTLIDSVKSSESIFTDADFQKLLDNYEIAS